MTSMERQGLIHPLVGAVPEASADLEVSVEASAAMVACEVEGSVLLRQTRYLRTSSEGGTPLLTSLTMMTSGSPP